MEECLRIIHGWSYTKYLLRCKELHLLTLRNNNMNNKQLFLMKLRDDDLCNLCKTETDNNLHRFVNCQMVSHIWRQLESVLASIGINRLIDAKIIFCNDSDENPNSITNTLINCTRFLLNAAHFLKEPPILDFYLFRLKSLSCFFRKAYRVLEIPIRDKII